MRVKTENMATYDCALDIKICSAHLLFIIIICIFISSKIYESAMSGKEEEFMNGTTCAVFHDKRCRRLISLRRARARERRFRANFGKNMKTLLIETDFLFFIYDFYIYFGKIFKINEIDF